jgi:hypothetical protein
LRAKNGLLRGESVRGMFRVRARGGAEGEGGIRRPHRVKIGTRRTSTVFHLVWKGDRKKGERMCFKKKKEKIRKVR